jgi:CTD small phosphatase-like protein 2
MAQACVMVQPNRQESPHQQPILSSSSPLAKSPATFITSSVRKRKVTQPEGEDVAEKRSKLAAGLDKPPQLRIPNEGGTLATDDDDGNGGGSGRGLLSLNQPTIGPGGIEVDAAAHLGTSDTLFSPVFPSTFGKPEADCERSSLPARLPTLIGSDNASTDASTGTSTSLDHTESGEDEGAGNFQHLVTAHESLSISAAQASANGSHGTGIAAVGADTAAHEEEGVEEAEEDDLDFDPYVFIKRLPPLHACIAPRTTFLLPRQTRHSLRKTLVLDLDETLVHSTLDGDCIPDFTFPVRIGSVCHMVAVRKRPHLHIFLERVARLYEVVVFTASQQIYAEQLLDTLDPNGRLIKHRVYRDSCVVWEGNFLKDLTYLGRDLAHTLIIDNSPQAFGFQLDNGVPIESWYDDDHDTELLKLLPFLEQVAEAQDVRPAIAARFGLRQLVEAAPSLPCSPMDSPSTQV